MIRLVKETKLGEKRAFSGLPRDALNVMDRFEFWSTPRSIRNRGESHPRRHAFEEAGYRYCTRGPLDISKTAIFGFPCGAETDPRYLRKS